jgi:glycosyltransferase involved in cell wall biosynthesis
MKKILLVANTSWSMVKFRVGLMKRLVEEGYDVTVLAPKDDYSEEIKILGCHYVDLEMDNKGSSIFNDFKMMRKLYHIYKKLAPDLIFHYTIKPNIYGTLAAKKAGIKSIAVITGLGYTFIHDNLTAKIAKKLYKKSLKHAQQVWFINVEDKNKFLLAQLLDENKMYLLPSEGIDTDKFAPLKADKVDDKFHFILIARLLWDKGIGEYVEVAKRFKEKYPHVVFDLVGVIDAQNPKAISAHEIEAWSKEGWVDYKGYTSDVRGFIAQSDCVVLPSYREGVSMILMESAAMQKPIIASNVPGCRDLVNHNMSGYLCRVKSVDDLELKMERMIHLSVEQRDEMGREGRKFMLEEFNESLVIDKYLHAIKMLTWNEEKSQFSLKKTP